MNLLVSNRQHPAEEALRPDFHKDESATNRIIHELAVAAFANTKPVRDGV
jgi:hypothetical protein